MEIEFQEKVRMLVAEHLGMPVAEVSFATQVPIEKSAKVAKAIAVEMGLNTELGSAKEEVSVEQVIMALNYTRFSHLL